MQFKNGFLSEAMPSLTMQGSTDTNFRHTVNNYKSMHRNFCRGYFYELCFLDVYNGMGSWEITITYYADTVNI